MSLARTIDKALVALTEFASGPNNHFCRLETACDEHTLVADDGTLISFIELHGALQMVGDDEFARAVGSLVASCSGYLKNRGHALQFVIQRDPDTVRDEIDENFSLMKNTARAMGMNIDGIMDSNADRLELYSASEHTWIAVWTTPRAIHPKTRSQAAKLAGKANVPPSDAKSMRLMHMEVLLKAHRNFLHTCMSAFDKSGLWATIMPVKAASWWIRRCVDPEWTSRSWKPLLPGDRIPLREPDAGDIPVTGALYPKLKHQLFPRPAITDAETVRIGNFLHRPVSMDMAPQQPMTFTSLFNELIKHRFGWRISFHLSGDGLHGTSIKQTLAQIFSFTNSENKLLVNALRDLREMTEAEGGSTIVKFEANFDTWVDAKKYVSHKDALDALDIQTNYLVAALQSWGSMEVCEITGDPLLPFSATLPGVCFKTPSTKAAAPFNEALAMAPLARPASPWRKGSFLLRSLDGKLLPMMPMSGLQASWIEIGYGGLGSGKSFWINCTNWSFLFQPGLDELPHLGIIDIGPSSSGLIRLLEYSLPQDQRKYVAAHKLVMSASKAINPFDTPLGCRRPFESQMTFLVSLLCAMCTPENQENPSDGVSGLVRMCITRAYEDFGHKKAKVYQPNVAPEIDERIPHVDLAVDAHTTWWELVDAFYKAGMTHEATLAQRFAVPLLSEVQAYARDSGLRTMFDFQEQFSGQHITDFVSRKLSEAYASFPIFQRPTRFDLGEARIVSLDLADVAPRGSTAADRQTGIMYLLALQLVSGRYFYTPEDPDAISVPGDPELTLQYQAHHRAQIKKLMQMPKRIVADEFHRAARTGAIVNQITQSLETITRESRKWLISIGLYSQKIEDMPKAISDLATTHYILGADSPEVQRQLIARYDLNSAGKAALGLLRKPDHRGSTCLHISTISSGRCAHLVVLTAGPQQVWAYSTTREDMDVRDELYRQLGVDRALDILAEHHPSGVKDYVQSKRSNFAASGVRQDAIQDTIQELILASRRKHAQA
jgi:intracellular multiplication protein IcmB